MDLDADLAALLEGFPVLIRLPVQWGDQDAFGHVNNVIYFRWFESARIEYCRRIGLLEMLETERLGPILASIQCDYRRPLTHPDDVLVAARVSRIGRTSLGMEHRIISQAQRAIAAEGNSTLVVFDYATNTPHPIPTPIREAIVRLEGRSF
ncbi:MAG: acyl-CoA thioesterase [Isosphaeraceae bacterium]|nr:acyl-CoA thioesterase [Isosphaeraceae bacterium]